MTPFTEFARSLVSFPSLTEILFQNECRIRPESQLGSVVVLAMRVLSNCVGVLDLRVGLHGLALYSMDAL